MSTNNKLPYEITKEDVVKRNGDIATDNNTTCILSQLTSGKTLLHERGALLLWTRLEGIKPPMSIYLEGRRSLGQD
jgi:hypothetical protein